MADDKAKATPQVEVSATRRPSVTMDEGGVATSGPTTSGLSVDVGDGLGPTEEQDAPAVEGADTLAADDTAQGGEGEDTAEGGDKEEGAEEDDLGEWDPDNPEVAAKFDARYFNEDNTLNEEALSKEFWASFTAAEGEDVEARVAKSGLKPATYAWLKDRLGISEPTAKKMEAALVSLQLSREVAARNAVFTRVGGDGGAAAGEAAFTAAIEWAKGGGYTEAQRNRFNELEAKGGEEFDEAVDALLARHLRATGGTPAATGRGPAKPSDRRRSSPPRDATTGAEQGQPAGDVYTTREEHKKDWEAALRGVDDAKRTGDRNAIREAEERREAVRKKARRSQKTMR